MAGSREDYERYLQSDHWRDLKRRAFEIHGCVCMLCGKLPVDGHHLVYRDLYDVKPEEVVPLCRACHEKVHEAERAGRLGTDYRSSLGEDRLARLISVFPPTLAWRARAGVQKQIQRAKQIQRPLTKQEMRKARKRARQRERKKHRAERKLQASQQPIPPPLPNPTKQARRAELKEQRRLAKIARFLRTGFTKAPPLYRPQRGPLNVSRHIPTPTVQTILTPCADCGQTEALVAETQQAFTRVFGFAPSLAIAPVQVDGAWHIECRYECGAIAEFQWVNRHIHMRQRD